MEKQVQKQRKGSKNFLDAWQRNVSTQYRIDVKIVLCFLGEVVHIRRIQEGSLKVAAVKLYKFVLIHVRMAEAARVAGARFRPCSVQRCPEPAGRLG
jgi:hypothetical protein